MIDIKIFGKAKDSARNGQGGSTGTSTVSVKEAAHASEADYAAKAGKADASTLAERAESAAVASRANVADRAMDVDEEAEALTHYLRNDKDDVARGLIGFLKGLSLGDDYRIDEEGNGRLLSLILNGVQAKDVVSPGFDSAGKTGFWVTDDDGRGMSYMELDKLYVRYKAVFDELEIRKRTYVGGNAVFSNASSKLTGVDWLDKDGKVTDDITAVAAFKCYVKTDDGTTQTQNLWEVGDLALCQTFNIKEGTTKNATNKVYWRLVTEVGDDYFVLSNKVGEYKDFGVDHSKDAELYQGTKVVLAGGDAVETEDKLLTAEQGGSVPSDFPEKEDSVVQFGSRVSGRGNVEEILTYTPNEDSPVFASGVAAPAFIQYKGIDSFSLEGKAKTVISPSGNVFRAKKFIIETGGDLGDVSVPLDFGVWQQGTAYPYYARVSHNGSLWLLSGIAEGQSSTEEPSDGGKHWVKQVAKGEDGEGLNVKGTAVVHYKNYAAFKADSTEHFDVDDPYIELKNGKRIVVNGIVLLDSSADYSEEHAGDTQTGFAQPTILQFVFGIYNYDPQKPTLGDGYMDADGHLWVAGQTAWTDAGFIKGEKGDKGDDAEWYEVTFNTGDGTPLSAIVTDENGVSKMNLFALSLYRHVGNTATRVKSGDRWKSSVGAVAGRIVYLLNLKITDAQIVVTCTYNSVEYKGAIAVVKEGQTGETGASGQDATDVIVEPEVVVFDTDDDGNLSGTQQATIRLRKGGKALVAGTDYTVSNAQGVNVTNEGLSLGIENGSYVLTIDSAKIMKYVAEDGKTVFPYTDGYVNLQVSVGSDFFAIRVSWRVNYAKYMGKLTVTQKAFESRLEAYKSDADGSIKDMSSTISQMADSIELKVNTKDLVTAGITLNEDGVVLMGDKVSVKNGDTTAALFEGGKLNAELIEVTHLYAKDTTGKTIGYWGDTDRDDCNYNDGEGNIKTAPLFAGGKNAENAVFRVNSEGETFTRKLRAIGGTIANFKIEYDAIGSENDGSHSALMYLNNNAFHLNNGWSSQTEATIIGGQTVNKTIERYRQSVHINTDMPGRNYMVDLEDTVEDQSSSYGMSVKLRKESISPLAVGLQLDVAGAAINRALYIPHGHIYGFRLHNRIFTSVSGQTFDLEDCESLVTIYSDNVRLNMPSAPDDGMMIFVHNHSTKDSYLQGATFEWIESYGSNAYRKRQNVTELTILPGRMMILTYDSGYGIWIGAQFMN